MLHPTDDCLPIRPMLVIIGAWHKKRPALPDPSFRLILLWKSQNSHFQRAIKSMLTPLCWRETSSLLSRHPTYSLQTFCIIFPIPNIQRHPLHASLAHPSTLAFLTATGISDNEKKLHVQLRSCTTPDLLLCLWWSHQEPPPTFLRSRINRRQDCGVGTVKIWLEEGEISHFLAFGCIKIHHNLTNPLQNDVHTQPNPLHG
jgi:hypothetical protein